jgi:hypothetical protein
VVEKCAGFVEVTHVRSGAGGGAKNECDARIGPPARSEQRLPSRAIDRSRNCGASSVLGVEADRFDHEVEPVGAVDFASYAVGHFGPDELNFGEVIEPVNTPRVAILEQEHRVRRIFRPREQEQMIGAEVEHEGGKG